jgi:hypothetical protein
MGCGCNKRANPVRNIKSSAATSSAATSSSLISGNVPHSMNLTIIEARRAGKIVTEEVSGMCGPTTALFTNETGDELTIRYRSGAVTTTKVVQPGANFCAPPVRVDRLALVIGGKYTENTIRSLLAQNKYWVLVVGDGHIPNLNFAQVQGTGSIVQRILQGLAVASTVGVFRYVAICHDSLYPKEHFEHPNYGDSVVYNQSTIGLGSDSYGSVGKSFASTIWNHQHLLTKAQSTLMRSMQTITARDIELPVDTARSVKTYNNIVRLGGYDRPTVDDDKTWGVAKALWETL